MAAAQPYTLAYPERMINLYRLSAKQTFSVALGGALIGLIHQFHVFAAVLVALKLVNVWVMNWRAHPHAPVRNTVLVLGSITMGLVGTLGEWWGTTFGYWTYHDLPPGVLFPYWLPFAWALMFTFLYCLEEIFIDQLKVSRTRDKLLLTTALAAIFPTVGEIVAINMGVWTYHWPYQVLGMPPMAVRLLIVFHTTVFVGIGLVCRLLRVQVPVFGGPPRSAAVTELG